MRTPTERPGHLSYIMCSKSRSIERYKTVSLIEETFLHTGNCEREVSLRLPVSSVLHVSDWVRT